jgi:hypothetical protein
MEPDDAGKVIDQAAVRATSAHPNHHPQHSKGLIVNIRMFRRISRPVMTLAMATGVIAVLASSPASAQGTPAQQAACQGDAMRLCGAYIPDVGRIKSCMMSQVKNLSPGCRAQMGGGGKKHARHYHHRRHQ